MPAHLLEKYEREYVARKAGELFPAEIVMASNVAFRELPEWAEKKNQELQSQMISGGMEF